jgi:hypothetical protein
LLVVVRVGCVCSIAQTNSIERNTSWEANSRPAGQEILRLLWNPKVHYHVNKTPSLISIQRQLNPIHIIHHTYLRLILILSSHLRLGLPDGLLSA